MAYIGREPSYGLFEKQTETGDGVQTVWSLLHTVSSASSIWVNVGGVIQEPDYSYALSGGGTEIEFMEAPPNNSRIYIVFLGEKLLSPVTSVDDGAITRAKLNPTLSKQVPEWYIVDATQTLESGKNYIVDTSGGTFNVNMPPSPSMGDTVFFVDGTSSFSVNNLTISGNGNDIMGSISYLANTNNANFGFVFYNSTYGWRLIE